MCFSVIGPLIALLSLIPVLPCLLQFHPQLDLETSCKLSDVIVLLNKATMKFSKENAEEIAREVQATGLYLEYRQKMAQFVQDQQAFVDNQQRKRDEIRKRAEDDWDRISAHKYEAIAWDWCPIWRVLMRQPRLLPSMPRLPWKHDGE